MLKGTMKIELTDVHTVKKETVVEHNMITNALTNIFKPLGHLNNPSTMYNSIVPYYQKLLGGLLLFDNAIEENPNMLYAPANTNMVGCAAYWLQNNTTGKMRGGFNQTESELNLTNRYMKYVYDFATSQANGTINCVCLTHLNGDFTSYGSDDAVFNSSYPLGLSFYDSPLQYVYTNYTDANTGDKYSGLTLEKTEVLFLIDRQADVAYYFRIDNATSIHIIKRRAYLQSISVLENPYSQKALVDDIELSELSTPMPTNYFAYNFDHADKCLYIFASSGSYKKPNETLVITKINISNWHIQQYEWVNTTGVNITTNGMRYAFAHNGYVYFKSYNSPYHIYKFEIGNSANVVKIDYHGFSSINGFPHFAYNGRIYYESYHNELYVVNEYTNQGLKPENQRIYSSSNGQICYTPVLNEPMIYFGSYGNWSTSSFIFMTNYLATINNLSEPVTKTADKTMKITYIIQEQ